MGIEGAIPAFAVAIIRELGELSANVENLQRDVQQGESGRGRLYDKVEENTRITAETKRTVDSLKEDVAGLKPIVEDYKSNKNKFIGLVMAVSGLSAIIGWGLSHAKGWFGIFKGYG